MGPDHFVSHPLPEEGEIILGRGQGADITLADPVASRKHARLTLGPRMTIEDLGSANGTRLRDRPLDKGKPMRLLPGEAIAIGSTILLVQSPGARRMSAPMVAYAEFETRVTWECARAESQGDGLCLLRVRLDAGVSKDVWEAALAEVLRPMDVATTYAPGQFDILLSSLTREAGEAMAVALQKILCLNGADAVVDVVAFPRDGRHLGALRAALSRPDPGLAKADAVTADPAMRAVLALADRAAVGEINVLILGETGVGKDVMARRIHDRSSRAGKPFVCVNCAALSESLLESELFGHERGAFTGAATAKPGLLETAPGGTVLLDEIGDMAPSLQAKLLRAIEGKEITRVGGLKPRPIDVRFLSATNRDLEAAVQAGSFRRDLFFRLNGMSLFVPPLRERGADVPRLAQAFLVQACAAGKRRPLSLSPGVLSLLSVYAWPGNVRELRNLIERAVLLADGDEITEAHLPPALSRALPASEEGGDERARIMAALSASGGNQSRAAQSLGISRKVLIARLNRFGLPRPQKGQP